MSNFVSQISKCDADFVKTFVDFVNGKMSSKNNTGKELAKAHRYLQQEMFEVFFCFMKELAYNYKMVDMMLVMKWLLAFQQKPINASLNVILFLILIFLTIK